MIGNQIPRFRIEPKRSGTDGGDAALLMEKYAYKLDDWQRLIVDCLLGYDENGKYNVTSAGISVARQNGKGCILETVELYRLVVLGEKIIHSAHQGKTARAAFRRFVDIVSNKDHPELVNQVKQIRYATGEEAVYFKNGGSIEYMSRTRQAARGYDGFSCLVLDEAQEVQEEAIESLLATLSSSKTGTQQVIYTGTPPYPGCPGTVFARLRSACLHTENPDGMSWHEWSAPYERTDEVDVNDRKMWYYCNPALGIRLTEKFTAEEARSLSPDGFGRERLNCWFKTTKEVSMDLAINADAWAACASDAPKPETGKTAFGVKFYSDGSAVALAGCIIAPDGKARISLIEQRPAGEGLRWLADFLNARYKKACCVVIDGKNGADLLIDKISDIWRFKASVIKPSSADICNAASMLINEVNEQTLTWYRPQTIVNDSAIAATKRRIAGGFGFGGSLSPVIEACSLALYGARTSKRDPSKVMRIG